MVCGLETLMLPLTVVAAAEEDDSLAISIPFNLVIVTITVMVDCLPYRKRVSILLCTIHFIGINIATLAAAIDIKLVIVSGQCCNSPESF